MMLLLAVGIDANGHNVILAWALVESENESSWRYFLCLLQQAIPEVSSEECVFISDRDKGLLEADEVLGPKILHSYCCQHLRNNFIEKFKKGLEGLFWRVAYAHTPEGYEYHLKKVDAVNKKAADYLQSIVSLPPHNKISTDFYAYNRTQNSGQQHTSLAHDLAI